MIVGRNEISFLDIASTLAVTWPLYPSLTSSPRLGAGEKTQKGKSRMNLTSTARKLQNDKIELPQPKHTFGESVDEWMVGTSL
jgi:hypothetical protein